VINSISGILSRADAYPEYLDQVYSAANKVVQESRMKVSLTFGNNFANIKKFEQIRVQLADYLVGTHANAVGVSDLIQWLQIVNLSLDHKWLKGMMQAAVSTSPIGSALAELYFESVLHDRNIQDSESVHDLTFFDNGSDLFLLDCVGSFPSEFLMELAGVSIIWREICKEISTSTDAECFYQSDVCWQRIGEAIDGELEQRPDETVDRLFTGAKVLLDLLCDLQDRNLEVSQRFENELDCKLNLLLQRKSLVGCGYHAHKRLSSRTIDECLRKFEGNPQILIRELAASPFICPGNASKSSLLSKLTATGGPMEAVFSDSELKTLGKWIDSLAHSQEFDSTTDPSLMLNKTVTQLANIKLKLKNVERVDFVKSSWKKLQQTSWDARELYFQMINLERFPETRVLAETFLRMRLVGCESKAVQALRPMPCDEFRAEALYDWVYIKHREQVDSYPGLREGSKVSRERFIQSTVQLAPLILIDGAWLQYLNWPGIMSRSFGDDLVSIFRGETGQGDWRDHHANLYRKLLSCMDIELPDTSSRKFAFNSQFNSTSFHAPLIWLTLSSLPTHYMPELLGLNLAVELAGVGGPYLYARDTLRRFGYPTTFVDVHNSVDNIAEGHSAQAVNAIVKYLEEEFMSRGRDETNILWHRVWAGLRLMLPQPDKIDFSSLLHLDSSIKLDNCKPFYNRPLCS